MSTFLEKMAVDLDLRGSSFNTKKKYLLHVKQFSKHFSKPPELMGETEIRAYLHHEIAVKKLSSSNAAGCYYALQFFFETTLGKVWDAKAIPRIKVGKKLPNVLSLEEVRALFGSSAI